MRDLRFDMLNNELRFSCRFKIVVNPAILFFSVKSSLYADTKQRTQLKRLNIEH
jgi:hypothetical protein